MPIIRSNINFQNFLLSILVCSLVYLFLITQQISLLHWSSLYALFIGIFIFPDIIRWIRRQGDVFEPKFFTSLVIFISYSFAPLLYLFSNDTIRIGKIFIPDGKFWIGITCGVYCIGIAVYKLGVLLGGKCSFTASKVWRISGRRFLLFSTFLMVVQVLCQIRYVAAMGGFSGWANIKTFGGSTLSFEGLGPIMVIARSFPIVLSIFITYYCTKFSGKRDKGSLQCCLFIFFMMLVQIICTGLSGSRNSIIYSCIWFIYLVHSFWKPVKRKSLLIAFLGFIFFMYFYGFYKNLGVTAFKVYREKGGIEAVQKMAQNRNMFSLLIGDLSRIDVNASQLYVLFEKPWQYRFRNGVTYIDGIVPLIPKKIWKNKKPDSGKVIAGTEMLYGPSSYQERSKINRYGMGRRSTRIYGLLGEWLLNFGLPLFFLPYFVAGVLIGVYSKFYNSLKTGDVRNLLIPAMTILSFCLIINDFSNHIAYFIYSAILPFGLVFSSKKVLKPL